MRAAPSSTTPRWVLARLAAAEAELEAIAGVRGGRVRLASFSTASASLLPPALARFSERHPDVQLNFSDTKPNIQMLRAAELEVAVVFQFHGLTGSERLYGEIELHPLVEDPMYLALPLGHPLAHKPRVRLKDVAGEISIQEGDPRNACRPCRRPPAGRRASSRRSASIDDYNVVQGLVASGIGVSLLRVLRWPTCARTSLCAHWAEHPGAQDGAATLAGRYRSPATEAMLGILAEVATGLEPLPSGTAVAAA